MTRKRIKKEPNYEPSFDERKQEAFDALPPMLKPLAQQAELMTTLLDFKHPEEHHVCRPPEISKAETDRLDKDTVDHEKSWVCACGLLWKWRSTRRTWHPEK